MEFIDAKQILSSWSDGDTWFGSNYNMNIYKGCSHGCIYCDSRSSCYQVLNFDRVRAKKDVLLLLERELMSKRKKGIIATGAMSDPYNPLEEKHELTRGALELINKYGFGSSLLTKSDLVVRDIDVIKKIKTHSPVVVKFTITTYDDGLCKKVEPNVTVSSDRFTALKRLSDEGIFTGVHIWPILPFINDTEENVKSIVRAAYESGAKYVTGYFAVTLRQNQRIYYYKQLDKLFPGLKQKYINTYGDSYECTSVNEKKLYEVLASECKKYGLLYKMSDIRQEIKRKYDNKQMTLF
ncbi:radical SAM protein [Clostridium sp. D2Q-11]|uniref:Radical SAM protein n=1 Tax=Anaeromonas frigoriresistens TaxID=2683708 RepID=A0A942V064_9FIRM|nr:radical SAM protein [Anaeromonas frigoriresistens]MBS4538767.1 radical SAM protein [Anaeromonas frigoriresistens]